MPQGATREPISYERSGEGPAVVLLHPTGLGPGPLQPLADRLEPDHLVIVPARRGYGTSTGLAAPRSMDDHIDDLIALLDELGLASATFVGVSGGATLLLALAIRCPERIDGGLAHEPLIGNLAPDLHAAVADAIERMLEDPSPRAVSVFVADLIGVETWNRLTPTWRDAVEQQAAATRAEARFYPAFEPTTAELTALVDLDLVTSVGARSGPIRQGAATRLSALGLTSRTVAGTGHLAPVEALDAFTDLVRSIPQRRGVDR